MAAQPDWNSTLTWRKSSASVGAGECVEVAKSGMSVLIRDSRDRSGPVLEYTASQWLGFVRRVKGVDTASR